MRKTFSALISNFSNNFIHSTRHWKKLIQNLRPRWNSNKKKPNAMQTKIDIRYTCIFFLYMYDFINWSIENSKSVGVVPRKMPLERPVNRGVSGNPNKSIIWRLITVFLIFCNWFFSEQTADMNRCLYMRIVSFRKATFFQPYCMCQITLILYNNYHHFI